jgi:hypothetical protein
MVGTALPLAIFLLAALVGWSVPAAAQTAPSMKYQLVRVRVYVFNVKDGTAIPFKNVYYKEIGRQYCGTQRAFERNYVGGGTTDAYGIAQFEIQACPGEAIIYIPAASLFRGTQEAVIIRPGQQQYETRLALEPNAENSSEPSPLRLLHVRVQGRVGNELLPVHYAGIYDMKGNFIGRTGWDGTATFWHKEVYGETVTLRAVSAAMPGNDEDWQPASASFIVGAAERSLRTTRAEDYITFVLNGNNTSAEKHQIDILVRGSRPDKKNSCHCVRIPGASVFDSRGQLIATTDSSGRAVGTIEAPLGEAYTVRVLARNWKAASKQLQSGTAAGIGPTFAHENVEFMLEPAHEHQNLTVEVLDKKTDKPVSDAVVTLYKPDRFPGTVITHGTTDHNGEVIFASPDIDEALLNGEARIGATHGGAQSAVQTIPESQLFSEEARYVVFLQGKEEKTKWSGTWYNGPYTIQVSGGTGSLGYTYLRHEHESCAGCVDLVDQGGGSCTVKGNVATCTYHGRYTDGAKDVTYAGHGTLEYSGDRIAVKNTQDTGSIKVTSGTCPDIKQCTALHPGAEFESDWMREKP